MASFTSKNTDVHDFVIGSWFFTVKNVNIFHEYLIYVLGLALIWRLHMQTMLLQLSR